MDGMLARIPSRLLTEWMVYARLEPFGEERADLRAGIIAATLANVNRDPKVKREPWRADEFMPSFEPEPEPEPPDWERLLARVEALNAAFGGSDLRH